MLYILVVPSLPFAAVNWLLKSSTFTLPLRSTNAVPPGFASRVNPSMESESAPSDQITSELSSMMVGKAAGFRAQVAGSYPPCRFIRDRRRTRSE
jgi:hypothetical protein